MYHALPSMYRERSGIFACISLLFLNAQPTHFDTNFMDKALLLTGLFCLILRSGNSGAISGSALLVDYVLTITVSITACVDAMFSYVPQSFHY